MRLWNSFLAGNLLPRPQVKYHDIHHWDPSVNFGQYTMLWDHVFRSFRAYPGEGGKEAVWAKVRPPPPQSTDSKDE